MKPNAQLLLMSLGECSSLPETYRKLRRERDSSSRSANAVL
jgi:hypothetical protein